MAEGDRSGDRNREEDSKRARRSASAVISSFLPEPAELNWTQLADTNPVVRKGLDIDRGGKLGPTLPEPFKLFKQDDPQERVAIDFAQHVGGVALEAATLGMARG